jgi:hypothetical protein
MADRKEPRKEPLSKEPLSKQWWEESWEDYDWDSNDQAKWWQSSYWDSWHDHSSSSNEPPPTGWGRSASSRDMDDPMGAEWEVEDDTDDDEGIFEPAGVLNDQGDYVVSMEVDEVSMEVDLEMTPRNLLNNARAEAFVALTF